jgi:hypothetical protein
LPAPDRALARNPLFTLGEQRLRRHELEIEREVSRGHFRGVATADVLSDQSPIEAFVVASSASARPNPARAARWS